jgi:methylmalonyl-CoA mutase N-terminal domain/subunit
MSPYSGYGSPEETNLRYRFLLERGSTGVSVALDLPTQIGLDSDHPMAKAEVGKAGVPISSLEDFERLFDGIPLDKVKHSGTTANAIGPIMLSLYIALAKKQGVSPQQFSIRLQNDPLKEYVARGTYIFPLRASVDFTSDVIQYCVQHFPHWIPVTISGYHMREAGATAVQEIAFTLANAIAYLEGAINKGMEVDDFAPSLFVFLAADVNFFEEIAKFRAFRKMWAKILRERFRAKNPKSLAIRFSSYTTGSSMTAQQPFNNIVRAAIECLAAALGGVQMQNVSCMDEALGTPTEEAAKLALRTQQIIANETGIADVIDPLGGSYYLETLTLQLQKSANEYLDKIERIGGAIAAIEKGYFQHEITQSAYRRQMEIEKKERAVVGVNTFTELEQTPIRAQNIDPELEKRQIERLRELRERRDNTAVEKSLQNIRTAAASGKNVIPSILEGVENYATVGEIVDALKSVVGEYKGPGVIL